MTSQKHFHGRVGWTRSAMTLACAFIMAGLLGLSASVAAADAPGASGNIVNKIAADFEQAPWTKSPWNKAAGEVALDQATPTGIDSHHSLKLTVDFSGKGFEYFTANPPAPLVIPGDTRQVTISAKISDTTYPIIVNFVDGWGRAEADGKQLQWTLKPKGAGQWTTATFTIPKDWVQPITISGVTTHDYSAKDIKKQVTMWVDHLTVKTDISGVDPKTGLLRQWKPEPHPKDPAKALKQVPATPLVQVNLSTGHEGNEFSGETPALLLQVRNWQPGVLKGKIDLKVFDDSEKLLLQENKAISAESTESLTIPMEVNRFGQYHLQADAAMANGDVQQTKMIFAYLPKQPTLTEAQRLASPYGLNVHMGRENEGIEAFRTAGVVWFRDYAWGFSWLERAKSGGTFAGWPDYPGIMQKFLSHGALPMPSLAGSISPPTYNANGSVKTMGPSSDWSREMAQIIMSFPKVVFWELGNEYDLNNAHAAAERKTGWKNYGLYHKKFGQLVSIMTNGKATAVENGQAGIHPDILRAMIDGHYFDQIGVVDFHHYCGVDAPETNVNNYNTNGGGGGGGGPKAPGLYFDKLRQMVRIAGSDGHDRQVFMTEFGWDTLAGKVVTPFQQAVYLQRAWMLGMAAGLDKQFWFYDYDSPTPTHYFDGCGLLDGKGQAKLSLCTLAALTAILPTPKYVGSINAGAGTQGYVFDNAGTLIASLWTIGEDQGPQVTFQAHQLADYLDNPLAGNSVKLSMAPVYAIGIAKDGAWYRQTAYDIHSNHLEVAAAGDQLKPVIRIHNNRAEAISGTLHLDLPANWKAARGQHNFTVAPGKDLDVTLPFTVDFHADLGYQNVAVVCQEDGKTVKQMPLRVLVTRPLSLTVGPIKGAAGQPASVEVTILNLSASPQDGTLSLKLPASWKVLTPPVKLAGLKPDQQRKIECKFIWNSHLQPDESASVSLDLGKGAPVTQPIIPPAYRLVQVTDLPMNGDFSHWPAATKLPDWMLGSTAGKPDANLYLAWSPKGLYVGVVVHDSKIQTADPTFFWIDDGLELFVDTNGKAASRQLATTDHQFWFVPLVKQNRVYAGEWQRGEELKKTRYDLPGIQSAAAKHGDGYVMQLLLPAKDLPGFHPQAGQTLGINMNLNVRGHDRDREVFWPRSKNQEVQNDPQNWGTMTLER